MPMMDGKAKAVNGGRQWGKPEGGRQAKELPSNTVGRQKDGETPSQDLQRLHPIANPVGVPSDSCLMGQECSVDSPAEDSLIE